MGQKGLVGRTLGRYRLDDVLGSGGFATVYRATDTALDRQVALKVLDSAAHRDPVVARRFLNEGQVLATLDHPAIVPVYDLGDDDGLLWLAVRLVDGPSLDRALNERRLAPHEALAVVDRLAAALDHAHQQGVVHRDVKPANVLLEDDQPERAWLTDFGIASTARTAGRYTVGAIGTAVYMAPEQGRSAEGSSTAAPPADRYALGCIAFEMVTGRQPYAGDDPVALLLAHATAPVPTTGHGPLDRFFASALAKDPAARPPSGATLAVGFREALAAGSFAPIPGPPSLQPEVGEQPTAVNRRPSPPSPSGVGEQLTPQEPLEAPSAPYVHTAVQPDAPVTAGPPPRPTPRQPPEGDLTMQARIRAKRAWPWRVAVGLLLAGVVGALLAWDTLKSGSGTVEVDRVADRQVGITFGVPVGWGRVDAAPGSIKVLAGDGATIAEVRHRSLEGDDDPSAELDRSGLCERPAEPAPVGGTGGMACTNPSGASTAVAVSTIANDLIWLIHVSGAVPAREAEAFFSTIQFMNP